MDSRVEACAVREAIRSWPGAVELWDAHLVHEAAGKRSAPLAAFAASSAVGLKFAAIVLSGVEGPTLFSDPDVLWFRDCSPLIASVPWTKGVRFGISQDCQASYDKSLLAAKPYALDAPPYINSGVMFVDGDLLHAVDIDALLTHAARQPNHFSEQTLFAIASRRLNSRCFDTNDVACFCNDREALGISFRGRHWYARHYVGPVRHVMWRDALALRIGVRPSRLVGSDWSR